MKKIFVVCFTGNNGLTDYSVSLSKELSKISELTLITAESYDPIRYKVDFPYKKIFRRTRNYPVDILRFAYFVLAQRPDIVLFQSWMKSPVIEWFILKIFKFRGISLGLTIHDLMPHYPKPWSRFVLKHFYYPVFDKLIVHSKKAEEALILMGVMTPSLMVEHGVYDIFNFDNLSRSNVQKNFPAVHPDDFVVLFFGHINTRKGIFLFLEATKHFNDKQHIKFLVAGENSLTGASLSQFNQYRNKPHLLLHDFMIPTKDVQNYFALADVVVTPYLVGTTSGVVKLAMAFDKPVIATDVGDFPEALNAWSGLVIPHDSGAEKLASAIIELKDSYTTYLQKINVNKEKFQWNRIANAYLNYLILDHKKSNSKSIV